MLLACLMVLLLLAASIFIHYEALRLISVMIERPRIAARPSMLVVVFGVMATHIVEIAVWGTAYWFAEMVLKLGQLSGTHEREVGGYFFFSAETYTSLGLGDLTPIGPIRLLAGMETLTGLLLIAWSASFTFVAMQKFWDFHTEQLKKAEKAQRKSR